MKEQYLQEFLKQIEPFRDLWCSVRFAGYAGKIGGIWILLGGRIQLSENSIIDERLIKVADFDTIFAFDSHFHAESLPHILQDIAQTENIHMNLPGGTSRDIRLCGEHDQNISWFNPYKFDREKGKDFFELERAGFAWTLHNNRQIATQPEMVRCLEGASEQLRRDTSINGVEALVRQLTPGLNLNSYANPELQILAPLPFDFEDTRAGGVRLTIPATVQPMSVSLKAFFYPEPQQPAKRAVSLEEHSVEDSTTHVDWKLEWPRTATHAKVHLFYSVHSIDALHINRWPASASLRGAVDEYFDSEHKRLCAALKWNDQKKSDEFELAVVRLLNILGIPAIWYGGKTVDPDRADAAAVVQLDKSTLFLLIECVRQKPDEKFSTLAERARHLRRELQIEAEVAPLVFTPAHVVESDVSAASQYGIGLIGSAEINQLVKLIETPETTVDNVLQHLRPRKTIADQLLETTAQLTDHD